MNSIANLEDYVLLNENNPVGYTYDIYSCIALLIHRCNSALLCHLEAYDDYVDIEKLNSILDLKEDKISFIEIFKGLYTNEKVIENIKNILKKLKIKYLEEYSFINNYEKGSIGYNYLDNTYYYLNDNYKLKELKK